MQRTGTFLFSLLVVPFLMLSAHAQSGQIQLHEAKSTAPKGPQPQGQAPFSSYEVYLLTPGVTANSQATSLISCDNDDGGVTVGSDDGDSSCYAVADSSGRFSITGLYYNQLDGGCTTGAAQPLYLEVRKGDVGGNANNAIALLGVFSSTYNCDYLYSHSNISVVVSEFTNIAAAFVLGPFATSRNSTDGMGATTFDSVSAAGSTSAAAMLAGFDIIQNYVSIFTGSYGGSDTNLSKQFYTIADVNDECIDTTGTSSYGCSTLFGYTTDNAFTGAYAPQDTWQTVANMAQDPTHNVSSEYNNIPATPPYAPNDSSAPTSWTLYTSGAPVLSSVSSTTGGAASSISGKKGNAATISGTGLTSASSPSTCPTIVVGFQVVNTATGATCNSTTLTFNLPITPAQSSISVYVNGLTSNSLPFTIKAN